MPDTFRDRFLDSHDRFQAAMLDAIRAHQAGVIIATEAFGKLDDLLESVEAVKALVMEQGAEIRALRERLETGGVQ